MDKDIFVEKRQNDPQGVIDDLIAQTSLQGKVIYDLNKKLVEGTLQRLEKWKHAGDLKIITKNDATVGGKPAVMLTFTVQLPDGTMQRVQTVTTAQMFVSAAAAVKGRYNM